MVVLRPFLIPRRQPSELLKPVDQSLHPVAQTVDRPIKGATPPLIPLAWDRHADAAPPQVRPDPSAAVAFVAHHALGAQLRAPAATPLDCPLLHQRLKHGRLVLFPRGEHDGDGLAVALGAQVDFSTEPTLAAPERLRLWVPFFAPAACWWARTTVAST